MSVLTANKLFNLKACVFAITLLLLLSYDFIPKRKLSLHPDLTQGMAESVDSVIGGNSQLIWQDKTAAHWVCDLKAGAPFPYCGVSVIWSEQPYRQINFSPYTHLDIALEYTGDAEFLRVFIRNYYPIADTNNSLGTAKFNGVTVRAENVNEGVSVVFDKLRVADWWIDDNHIPPEDVNPDVSKAIAIGIDIPHPIVLGKHEFKLKSITAVGDFLSRETLYSSVIIFWGMFLFTEMLISYTKLRKRLKRDEAKLTELKITSALYKEKAETDKLTGFLNREGLAEIVKNLEAQKLIEQYAILVLDIDHFKHINDKFGHVFGDEILEEIAEVTRKSMRSYDIISRWGGEEFVLLFHCLNESGILPFAEKVRETVEQREFANGKVKKLTVSIGGTRLINTDSFAQAFKRADDALYVAKSKGRNQVVIV